MKLEKKAETTVEPPAASKEIFTTDLSSKPPQMVKFAAGGAQERTPLLKGHEGFLVAHFEDGTRKTTELPNIVLDTLLEPPTRVAKPKRRKKGKKKGGAKGKVKKKPAAIPPGKPAAIPAGAIPPGEDEGKEKAKCRLYSVMYYKKGKCIGIRAKTGLCNQVMSFGGTAVTKDKAELKAIGAKVCLLLEEGRTVDEGKREANRLLAL